MRHFLPVKYSNYTSSIAQLRARVQRKLRKNDKNPHPFGMGAVGASGQAKGARSRGWSCSPFRAAATVSATREKSATREVGLPRGSSWRKGTK